MHRGRILFKPGSAQFSALKYKRLEDPASVETSTFIITVQGMMEFQLHVYFFLQ